MSKQIPVIHSSAIILDQESGQGTRMCSDTDTRGGPGRGTLVIQDQCESLGKYSSFHSSNYKCETRRFCRVCWDVKEDGDVLVSPCLCSGTQKYVHKSCLREWQKTVLRSNLGDDRAYRCCVCKSNYTISPVVNRWRSKAFVIILLFLCMSSIYYCGRVLHAWPMLAVVIACLFILGSLRGPNKSLFMMAVVSTVTLIFLILGWSRVYTLVVQNANGIKNSRDHFLSISLRPGILLSSQKGVRGSVFLNSVVFIFSYSKEGGTKGVILNQRILPRPDSFESNCHGSPSEDQTIECKYNDYEFANYMTRDGPLHFFGGPVYTLDKVVTLHTFGNVRGCQAIYLQEPDEVIYVGGLLSDVLLESNRSSGVDSPTWIFHGFSAWARGQLESEIQSGIWSVRHAAYQDLMYFRETKNVL